MDTVKPMRVGWIPYLNFRPMGQELRLGSLAGVELKTGHPAAINRLLAEGQIDIAPCSSVCMAFIPDYEMALPSGMVSRGKVMSVYLGLRHEHQMIYEFVADRILLLRSLWQSLYQAEDVRSSMDRFWEKIVGFPSAMILPPQVKLTSASASSSVLTRLLYVMLFGQKNYYEAVSHERIGEKPFGADTPVELLIGDEALEKRSMFPFILDLGQIWWDITRLPFVYATWQSKGSFQHPLKSRILKSSELADMRMKLEPAAYLPEMMPRDQLGKEMPLVEYWKNISYRIGPEEMKGLLAFICLAKKLRSVDNADAILRKIIRMQELSNKAPLI